MKAPLFTSLLTLLSIIAWSQTTETISMGNLYTNQVFYSLENGEVSNINNTDWDLAFATSGQGAAGSAILINEATTKIWAVPQDSSFWNTFDTLGFANNWEELLNSDTSWTNGALNKYRGANSNFFDLGWGVLNPNNNYWTLGDSLYLIQLADQSYKKLKINSLKQGVWEFQYADIDNQNKQVITIDKATYPTKNFIYHSLSTNQTIDREPAKTDWDFTLTKHRDEAIPGMIVSVTGIFNNPTLWTAKSNEVDYDAASLSISPQTEYNQNVTNIGREWKKYSRGVASLYDSIAYFLHRDGESDVYRIVFTEFGWSATGDATFEITKLGTGTGISRLDNNSSVTLFPNPSEGNVTLTFNDVSETLTVEVLDLSGTVLQTQTMSQDLSEMNLNLENLQSGLYLISLTGEKEQILKKLLIQ